jgi:hypothetical protein
MSVIGAAVSSAVFNAGFTAYNATTNDKKDFETVAGEIVQGAGQVAIDVGSHMAASAANVARAAAQKAATSVATTIGEAAAAGAPLAAAGPPGWVVELVIFIIQITAILLDAFWNPFKTYFNKDLVEQKEIIDQSIRKMFLKYGYDYPLEIKPNIYPSSDEEINTFREYINEYYQNNGIITPEDVISEEDIAQTLALLKRNIHLSTNPLHQNVNLLSGTTQNMLVVAAALKAKNSKKQKVQASIIDKAVDVDYKKFKPSPFKNYTSWILLNWQVFVSVSMCLIMTSLILTYFSN